MAGFRRGTWVTVMLSEAEFGVLKRVMQACFEAGGDAEQLVPLAIRLREAEERYQLLKGGGGDGDGHRNGRVAEGG